MKIKPCPYPGCPGGELQIRDLSDHFIGPNFCVNCEGCHSDGPLKPTKSEAIAAHNEVSDAVHRKPEGNWLPEEEDDGVPYAY